jgi:hypothetical protein
MLLTKTGTHVYYSVDEDADLVTVLAPPRPPAPLTALGGDPSPTTPSVPHKARSPWPSPFWKCVSSELGFIARTPGPDTDCPATPAC